MAYTEQYIKRALLLPYLDVQVMSRSSQKIHLTASHCLIEDTAVDIHLSSNRSITSNKPYIHLTCKMNYKQAQYLHKH